MPLFRLSERLEFPPAWFARSDGLLCIGGDLSPERIILAYKNGIFPWFSDDEPILWWSPDPRLVLVPGDIHISRTVKKIIHKKQFDIRVNTAFAQTINACAQVRKTMPGGGTWLVEEMIDAYSELHRLGYAHSIEAWQDNILVGGLYGICLGGVFFGESMFSNQKNASKIALVFLAKLLEKNNFDLIDCQVTTNHLLSMGATEISRNAYLDIIGQSIKRQDLAKDIWASTELLP